MRNTPPEVSCVPRSAHGLAAKAGMNDHASATSRHLEVERKFEVLDSTVTPPFDGVASIAGVKRAPPQMLQAVYYDTPGRDLAARQPSRSAAAPEAPTPAGTSSCRPDLLRALRSAPGWEMAATTTCPLNCAMSCWRSCATALWCRWPGSPPTARSMCCTAAMAPRSRSFPTTTSAPRLTDRTPNSGGGSGNSSWPRTRSPGVAPTSSCSRG